MENKKFNSLMLLCTQNDIATETYYNDVIKNFAMTKARRKPSLCRPSGIVVSDADCCRAASPFVRLVEGEERWDAPDHP
ncbi:hypothetical protein TNCV_4581141 [Trichonephila clavipes]|nr:hypothetical protein TNCV_4581141 [Trichonephila clavipes]